MNQQDYNSPHHPTWCPGCGNFGIWLSLKQALASLNLPKHQVVIVCDVGCSGNMTNTLGTFVFHSLHGRSIPTAAGIKTANKDLKVIVIIGDGGLGGEGVNHLTAASCANYDITVLVHNNQIYGLTTGQASPTTAYGQKTKTTPDGVTDYPLNHLLIAHASHANFIARGFSGDPKTLQQIIQEAISHPGFSIIDILQPCVTFNKSQTYDWYRERIQSNPKVQLNDYQATLKILSTWPRLKDSKIPTGIFFKGTRPPFHNLIDQLKNKPLIQRPKSKNLKKNLKDFL